jgi:hypothetical protein
MRSSTTTTTKRHRARPRSLPPAPCFPIQTVQCLHHTLPPKTYQSGSGKLSQRYTSLLFGRNLQLLQDLSRRSSLRLIPYLENSRRTYQISQSEHLKTSTSKALSDRHYTGISHSLPHHLFLSTSSSTPSPTSQAPPPHSSPPHK